jgi:hypothetical protein
MKIRIAVAVDSKGNWSSSGWESGTDAQKIDAATFRMPDSRVATVCFVEAEIEVPELKTVTAAVVK